MTPFISTPDTSGRDGRHAPPPRRAGEGRRGRRSPHRAVHTHTNTPDVPHPVDGHAPCSDGAQGLGHAPRVTMTMPIMTMPNVLCCQCGVAIEPNPVNTCVDCLQTRYDIGAGVAKQVQQHTCRGCNRFERRDGSWAAVEPESKELLAILLKKPRGLGAVRLADASFIWTEPHSKRLKLRVTIQKEVVAGAVLQQTFVIEYVIGNKQCPLCQRREAKDTWMALVQVRQRVPHKRTFLWLEQLILKHSAHADTVNIAEVKDGLDFFFDQRAHAEKLVSFLQSVAPTRYKTSKQLISQDVHTGKGKIKLTYSVEVLPICKDDVVWMPRPIAVGLGQMHQLCLCSKVSNVVHFVDPTTLQAGEMQPMAYWKTPFNASLSRGALVEFVILDLEYREADWRARRGRSRDAWVLADATVAKRDDFGANDRTMTCVTHLGGILKVGDHAWGYCVDASALGGELRAEDAARLPEVLLVKKSYSDRRAKNRRRLWRLRSLDKEEEPGVVRGRQVDAAAYEAEYESFMQDLEEDPSLRAQIHLYKDEEALEARQAREERRQAERARAEQLNQQFQQQQQQAQHMAVDGTPAVAVAPGLGAFDDGDEADDEGDDDFPDVGLEELLDDLTLGADAGDGGEGFGEEGEEGGAGPSVAGPARQPTQPVSFAPPPPVVEQFKLPGGNENATFYFGPEA